MTEGRTNSSADKASPEAVAPAKKQSHLNSAILAGVFLLGVVLPPEYKAFAPFLFLIPIIIAVVNKARRTREKLGDTALYQSYSQPMPDQTPSSDPYTCKPKDPQDPRRYKPIG